MCGIVSKIERVGGVCVHVCVFVCVYVRVPVCLHASLCMCVCMCVCTEGPYIYIYIYIYSNLHCIKPFNCCVYAFSVSCYFTLSLFGALFPVLQHAHAHTVLHHITFLHMCSFYSCLV